MRFLNELFTSIRIFFDIFCIFFIPSCRYFVFCRDFNWTRLVFDFLVSICVVFFCVWAIYCSIWLELCNHFPFVIVFRFPLAISVFVFYETVCFAVYWFQFENFSFPCRDICAIKFRFISVCWIWFCWFYLQSICSFHLNYMLGQIGIYSECVGFGFSIDVLLKLIRYFPTHSKLQWFLFDLEN